MDFMLSYTYYNEGIDRERRVQRVLDSLKSLSQCSNKRMYEWNDGQLEKNWSAIDVER